MLFQFQKFRFCIFHNQELFLLNCKACFQGVEKGYIGNEWVKLQIEIIQYSRPVKFLYLSSTNFTLFALEYFVSFIHYTSKEFNSG